VSVLCCGLLRRKGGEKREVRERKARDKWV
jgi:hypothetical protein